MKAMLPNPSGNPRSTRIFLSFSSHPCPELAGQGMERQGYSMTVYLIHFSQPIGSPSNPKGKAQHYIGWTPDDNLDARLADHRAGRGAHITRAAVMAGIELILARTWPGSRKTERHIKSRKEAPRLCPICNPHPRPTREITAQ